MRRLQRRRAARLFTALLLSAGITAVAWWGGQALIPALLFIVLAGVLFVALGIAPDAIARWRGHHWRWSWRRGWRGDGPDNWLGTRIPRRPRPPFMPPRAAPAQPERGWPEDR